MDINVFTLITIFFICEKTALAAKCYGGGGGEFFTILKDTILSRIGVLENI